MTLHAGQFQICQLEFRDVGFRRGERQLFSGMTFSIQPGTVLWIQGENGIGKTSVLKLAAGLSRPDTGEIFWTLNQTSSDPRQITAFQGHVDSFDPSLTVSEELRFWAETYNCEDNIQTLLSRVELTAQSHVKSGQLSAGQKRRLAFARVLMSNRPIWLLDEPKAAMDRRGQGLIDNLIQDQIRCGGIVIIATHNLAQSIGKNDKRLTLETNDVLGLTT